MRTGRVRADPSECDVVFALIRFARPLGVGLPADEERALAHRHLGVYVGGLCCPDLQRGTP